jgi:hypothetical protein
LKELKVREPLGPLLAICPSPLKSQSQPGVQGRAEAASTIPESRKLPGSASIPLTTSRWRSSKFVGPNLP